MGKRFMVDSTIAFDQSVAAGAGALARDAAGNAIVAWAETKVITRVAITARVVLMLISPQGVTRAVSLRAQTNSLKRYMKIRLYAAISNSSRSAALGRGIFAIIALNRSSLKCAEARRSSGNKDCGGHSPSCWYVHVCS